MTPWLDDGDVRVFHGDCLDVLRELGAGSIDAVVTDPPYGIGFMGHEWDQPGEFGPVRANGTPGQINDPRQRRRHQTQQPAASGAGHAYQRQAAQRGEPSHGGAMHAGRYDLSHSANARFQAWCEAWAAECLRVLKPGGHLLSFGGTRTYHRLTSGIEDAGFDVRDGLIWLYGSGFPKSLDVSKAIDKAAGHERGTNPDVRNGPNTRQDTKGAGKLDGYTNQGAKDIDTGAVTADALAWQGWGTALKPGHEPDAVARKPIVGTVAANVLAHGTGALNIDACRIGFDSEADQASAKPGGRTTSGALAGGGQTAPRQDFAAEQSTLGRWPANVVLDQEAAAELGEHTGELAAGNHPANRRGIGFTENAGGSNSGTEGERRPTEVGGASRFYYCAKASNADRGHENDHPTVKPVELMRWLVRLVTPPGGVVLDPFAGSGTTGVACRAEHVRCVLIEREAKYLPIIAGRLSQLSLLGGVA